MSMTKTGNKQGKYQSEDQLDPERRQWIREYAREGTLPCAVAFQIVEKKQMPPQEIGAYTDVMKIRLAKCQLGLFGYQPEKKIVKKVETVDTRLQEAIRKKAVDNRLACADAWEIAAQLKIPKLEVGNACETMSVKMHSCQLGAF
jgi:hypothetical protein